MSSTTLQPPPSMPYSTFFSGDGGNENHEASVSATPPFRDAASTSYGVVITVIVFSITVIVSILLCFFIRLLSSRCASRVEDDEESGGSSRVLSGRRRVQVQSVDEEAQIQRRDPIRDYNYDLPVATVKSARPGSGDGKSELVSGGDCPICLSKFEPKNNLRLLPICCHAFHADCVDLWLESNKSCPLCRSPIFASDSEILRKVLEQHQPDPEPATAPAGIAVHRQPTQSSVQLGSLVRAESENKMYQLAAEIGASRSWLRDYLENLSSRTASFRGSVRYFTGSSRRSEVVLPVPGDGYWDVEASRAGEEISEMFRWFSGI